MILIMVLLCPPNEIHKVTPWSCRGVTCWIGLGASWTYGTNLELIPNPGVTNVYINSNVWQVSKRLEGFSGTTSYRAIFDSFAISLHILPVDGCPDGLQAMIQYGHSNSFARALRIMQRTTENKEVEPIFEMCVYCS
jgi:hypothetical protein